MFKVQVQHPHGRWEDGRRHKNGRSAPPSYATREEAEAGRASLYPGFPLDSPAIRIVEVPDSEIAGSE